MGIGAFQRAAAIAGAIVLVASACGGEGETNQPPAEPPKQDETGSPDTPEPDGDGEVTISGEMEHRVTDTDPATVTCDGGGELYVEAAADVLVTGDCWDIDILADGATLTADEARDLDIEGSDNQVTVDTLRDLDIPGDGNTVDVTTVSDIDVEGSDNRVTYGEGSPEIDDEGSGNSIESS